jgi:hypothetical protein
MPHRTGVRRRSELRPEPFERPEAVWRALAAPKDLYDLEAAAAAELDAHGTILRPGEPGYPGPLWFYARRWWRRERAPFLAAADQLTPAEAALVAQRRRSRERPGS